MRISNANLIPRDCAFVLVPAIRHTAHTPRAAVCQPVGVHQRKSCSQIFTSSSTNSNMDKPSAFKIAFIGLGNLGEPLCNSLVSKGFHVTVTDLRKDNAQRLLNAGAHWADDVAGVCKVANLVITALPSVAASRAT